MRENGGIDIIRFIEFTKTPAVLGDSVEWRGRLGNPEVYEERLLIGLGLCDEGNRLLGVLVHGHLLARTVESTIGVITISDR